jgi:hypothetical protein
MPDDWTQDHSAIVRPVGDPRTTMASARCGGSELRPVSPKSFGLWDGERLPMLPEPVGVPVACGAASNRPLSPDPPMIGGCSAG